MARKTMLVRTVLSVAAFLVVMLSGIYMQAGFSSPSKITTGDAGLIRTMTPLLQGARSHVAVALIKPDGVRYALWGGGFNTEFEVGSLSKTMTAALLSDAEHRGEVTPDTTVGDALPELSGPVTSVRLSELASHHGGLPELATTLRQSVVMLSRIVTRQNPWYFSEYGLSEMSARAGINNKAHFEYSNMGYALLGLTLERITHMTYSELLEQRLLLPTGMKNTYVAGPRDRRNLDFTGGWSAAGLREAPWYMHAFSPAGGVRSTITDMVKYTQALLSGRLPGSSSMDPRASTDDDDSRVGYGWFTTTFRGQNITWHDGETAGYASVIAINRSQQTAVVILSDTAWPVITPAIRLLLIQSPHE
uniref:serine hydrolase domain-containing protein n=1 Tax=Klebsiella pneumoniae TaxID=573 RepID=UPI001E2AF5D8|nr:serine hydrolase domain-containing protein [Klebsiella pneumoniae]UNJ80880.1 beta-lactamase family protein [Klebsiella pneumoniae]